MNNSGTDFKLVEIHEFFLNEETRGNVLSNLICLNSHDSIVPEEYKNCVHVYSSDGTYYYGSDTKLLSKQQEKINRYKRVLPKGTVVETRSYDSYCTSYGPISKDTTIVPFYMAGWTCDDTVVEYDPDISYACGYTELEDTPFTIHIDMVEDDPHCPYRFSVVKSSNTVKSIHLNKSIYVFDDIFFGLQDLDDLISRLYDY